MITLYYCIYLLTIIVWIIYFIVIRFDVIHLKWSCKYSSMQPVHPIIAAAEFILFKYLALSS